MLRTFDEVATTILALTRERPVLLMLDDLQWADDDSIQLIRYLVRTMGSAPSSSSSASAPTPTRPPVGPPS